MTSRFVLYNVVRDQPSYAAPNSAIEESRSQSGHGSSTVSPCEIPWHWPAHTILANRPAGTSDGGTATVRSTLLPEATSGTIARRVAAPAGTWVAPQGIWIPT